MSEARPAEPQGQAMVWYRGWECGYEAERGNWTGEGYCAYRGGPDVDAYYVTAATWDALLDEIDAEEDE